MSSLRVLRPAQPAAERIAARSGNASQLPRRQRQKQRFIADRADYRPRNPTKLWTSDTVELWVSGGVCHYQAIDRISPLLDRRPQNPGSPAGVFCLTARLSVGDREPRADREGGELIDRVAARTPVRELFLIQPLGHAREPFAGVRADHRAGIKPAAIDTHRAAEAAADLERGLNDGVASRRGTTGSKYVTFRGGLRWAIPFLLVRSGREISVLYGMPL